MNASTTLTAQHQALRTQLQQLEAELRALGLWGATPPSEQALASTIPFMYDTLQVEEWLQWVFVPRLHALIDGGQPLPGACSVHPLVEHEWAQRAIPQGQAVLRVLVDIDTLLGGKPA